MVHQLIFHIFPLHFAISKRGYPLEIKRGFFEHHPVGSMMFPLIPYS
jgi:hypothetical protein